MFELLLVNILTAYFIILIGVTGIFITALIIRDNSIMDIAYGPLFAITAWILFLSGNPSPLALPLLCIITLWAIRLGTRIFRKNYGRPEDPRYAAWRQQWLSRSKLYFVVRSYAQIYLLQGFIIGIVLLPFTIGESLLWPSDVQFTPSVITTIGIAIALFGLLYETIADWQLDRFLARKRAGTESAVIMTTGLFRYSRRPNYFGESLVWWGLALSVIGFEYPFFSASTGIVVLSPLLITYVVVYITGPMLEKIFLEKYPDAYTKYMKQTAYFIPRSPKNPT
jgi:steroid 5-alpha reductase family enzyme